MGKLMKYSVLTIIAIILSNLFGIYLTGVAANVIVNYGDFESDTANFVVRSGAVMERASGGAYLGSNYCLKITPNGGRAVNTFKFVYGKNYKITFWAKLEENSSQKLQLTFENTFSPTYVTIYNSNITNVWQRIVINYNCQLNRDSDYAELLFLINHPSDNYVYYLDDITVESLDSEPNIGALMPTTTQVSESPFQDIMGNLKRDYIEYIYGKGLIASPFQTQFMPNDITTQDDINLTKNKLAVYTGKTIEQINTLLVLPPNITRVDFCEKIFDLLQDLNQTCYFVDPINGNDTNNGKKTFPLKTVDKARILLRTASVNMNDNLYVFMTGGEYYLTTPLRLNEKDSGKNGYSIIYKGLEGQNPIIHSGKTITGWTLHDAAKNIWKAPANGIETRQLYVNKKRAQRARSNGNQDNLVIQTAYGYSVVGNRLQSFARPTDLEIVGNGVWTAQRMKTGSIVADGSNTKIIMQQPQWGERIALGPLYSAEKEVLFYDNAYELLDAEGEWYLNKGDDTFYYKPYAGEDMNTVKVVAPILDQLLIVEGSFIDYPVCNIEFKNISFNYTTWLRPNYYGQVHTQNNYIVETELNLLHVIPTATVTVKKARNVAISRCSFKHLGSEGLTFADGVQNSPIIGNYFDDISGGGIHVGDVQLYNPIEKMKIINCDVLNNVVHNTTVEYFAATPISGGFPSDTEISNNEIVNSNYSGMHFNYGWSVYPSTPLKNFKITNNVIIGTCKMLGDGGAIYVLGHTGGSFDIPNVISENYIVDSAGGHGIYLDSGSNYYKVYNNVIDLTNKSVLKSMTSNPLWFMAYASYVHDDQIYDNFVTSDSKINNGENCPLTGTVVCANTNWTPEARAIIAKAGIQKGYLKSDYISPINGAYTMTENGNFENTSLTSLWRSYGIHNLANGYVRNSGVNGSTSFMVKGALTAYGDQVNLIQHKTMGLLPNIPYSISFYIKSDTPNARYSAEVGNIYFAVQKVLPIANQWYKFQITKTFDSSLTTKNLEIHFWGLQNGATVTYNVDNVVIEEASGFYINNISNSKASITFINPLSNQVLIAFVRYAKSDNKIAEIDFVTKEIVNGLDIVDLEVPTVSNEADYIKKIFIWDKNKLLPYTRVR